MKPGKFIVIDGGEGAGKGTVLKSLKKELDQSSVVFTREPGGSEFAEEIRREWLLSDRVKDQDPVKTFLWFWLARIDHNRVLVRPSLASGKHVISDRYDSSTWAYQICAQGHRDLGDDFLRMKDMFSVCPHLYIYLDVDPVEGLRRAQGRGDLNHFDGRDIHFHSAVRTGFLQFMGKMSDQKIRTRIIDANKPLEEVVSEALAVVHTALA